jgi:hypothetical protein
MLMPRPFSSEIAASATAAALAEDDAYAAASRIAPAPLTRTAFAEQLAAHACADTRRVVVVLGDPRVGKTAFVAAAAPHIDASLRLVDPVDAHCPDLAVALCLPEAEAVPAALRSFAACVILAFDLSQGAVDASLEGLRAKWLPALAAWRIRTGHALVCTLVGLCGDRAALDAAALDAAVPAWPRTCQALMDRFAFVESALRCSVTRTASDGALGMAASDVVVAAVRSARDPMRPLYCHATAALAPACAAAIRAMFGLFDVDGDGLLSNTELMRFQRAAFGVDVTDADIASLHARLMCETVANVAVAMRSGRSGVGVIDGVRLEGFFSLITALLVRDGEERVDGAAEVWHCLRVLGFASGCVIDDAALSAQSDGALDTQTRRAAHLTTTLRRKV